MSRVGTLTGVWMDGCRRGRGLTEPTAPAPARWARVWASRDLLLRVARRHGADPEDGEDIAQEAMLRAAEHPEVPEERLQAWLVAVTIRLCMDGHRRRTREARRWQRASARAAVQQPGQHPEDEACERSEAVWVASLAAEILPPRQAQALRLSAAGCDVHQVASELGVRYRAAESLLARARRTVRIAATTGLGVLAWVWRTHVPTTANPIPMALASATAATMMVSAIPTITPGPEQPGALPGRPPVASPMPAPAGESFAVSLPVPDRSSESGGSRRPTDRGGAVIALPPAPVPVPAPLDVPPLVEQVPRSLEAVVPLSQQPLPALHEVPPLITESPRLVTATPSQLGRPEPPDSPLPDLPELQGSAERSIADLDLVKLP